MVLLVIVGLLCGVGGTLDASLEGLLLLLEPLEFQELVGMLPNDGFGDVFTLVHLLN